MTGGINIPFIADVARWLKGTRDVEGSLDDVASSLDDLATGSARQQETAAGRIEKSYRDAAREVSRQAKQAGDDVAAHMKGGTGKATDATREFKSEATQNFSEVASSFSGDMTQAADGVQGLLGGLAQVDIPGVGLAAGAAAVLFGAAFGSMQADAAATKQAISDMYDDMLASGQDFLSNEFRQGEISKIVKDDPGAITSLADAQALAKRSGQELSTVLAALTGDSAEQQRVTGAFADQMTTLQKAIDDARASGTLTTDMYDRYEAKINDVRRDQGHWVDLLGTTATNMGTARAKVDASRDAMDKLTGAFDRTSDSASRVSQGIAGIPDNVTVKLSVDDSAVRRWAANPVVVNAVARVGRPQAT